LEVDAYRGDPRIFEVHPELSFAEMAGGPLVSKKTWNGVMRRRALLAANGIELPDELPTAGRVPIDDVLDAAAVAWTTARIARETARCLPENPPIQDGRSIAIWQ
jgi:predicted RNase H-like nuclease